MNVSADAVINTTTGAISIMPSGDNDDYFTFETVSGEPFLSVEGGASLFMDKRLWIKTSGSDPSRIFASASGTGYAGLYADASDGDFGGDDYLFLRQNNDLTCDLACRGSDLDIVSADSIYLFADGETDDYLELQTPSNSPRIHVNGGGALYFQTDGGVMYFKSSGDTDDFLIFTTPGNTPYIGAMGTSVIYFRDGSAYETVHADAFTEHTSAYEGTIDNAREDLIDWMNLEHPEGLAPEHYAEDVLSSSTYDQSLDITDKGTDLGKAGKALAKLLLNTEERIDVLDSKVTNIAATSPSPTNTESPQSIDSGQIDDLTTRVTGLENTVSSLSSNECPDYSDEIGDLEDIIRDLEDEMDDLKDEIRDLEDEIESSSQSKTTTTTIETTTTTETTIPEDAPSSSTDAS